VIFEPHPVFSLEVDFVVMNDDGPLHGLNLTAYERISSMI
jgi:hypothetical protein